MHVLSKSTYIRSLQCQKSLYLYKKFYHQRDPIPVNKQLVFDRGHKVGDLAHQLFPGGIDVSPPNHFKWAESAKQTLLLISKGKQIIYEAAFISEGILAAVDLLVKTDAGWNAYEVKSNLDVKDVHIRDAALQYFVIRNSGIDLIDFSIVHINRDFIKQGAINPIKYFQIKSVLSNCKNEQATVIENINKAKRTLALKELPKVDVGIHCYKPYLCDFYGTCWKHIRRPNVMDLEGLDLETKFNWYKSDIISFDEVMHSKKITKLQRTQILSNAKNSAIIDKKELAYYFTSFTYPVHFISFNFIQAAVPIIDGSSPFQKIPFAYSSISKDVFDTLLKQKYFCAEPGYNPFPKLLTSLLDNVQPLGDIFIINKDETLKLLQRYFDPKQHSSKKFDSFIERSKEFYLPFYKGDYYHPALKSNSNLSEMNDVLLKNSNLDLEVYSTEEQAATEYENLVYESNLLKMAETRENILQFSNAKARVMFEVYEYLKSLLNK